jgi:hypothetical protein
MTETLLELRSPSIKKRGSLKIMAGVDEFPSRIKKWLISTTMNFEFPGIEDTLCVPSEAVSVIIVNII